MERAIHTVRIGGTGRHPSLQEQLFIGRDATGQRGGLSGNPVDAILIATGKGCSHALIDALSDETLIDLVQAIGAPLDAHDCKRLARKLTDDLRAQVYIARIRAEKAEAEAKRQAERHAAELDPRGAVRAWIEANRPNRGSSKGAKLAANRAAYEALGFCPV